MPRSYLSVPADSDFTPGLRRGAGAPRRGPRLDAMQDAVVDAVSDDGTVRIEIGTEFVIRVVSPGARRDRRAAGLGAPVVDEAPVVSAPCRYGAFGAHHGRSAPAGRPSPRHLDVHGGGVGRLRPLPRPDDQAERPLARFGAATKAGRRTEASVFGSRSSRIEASTCPVAPGASAAGVRASAAG